MIEFLVGSSLAAAAGLNAWIPLLGLGLLARFTDVITLPDSWEWLTGDIALWVMGALLIVEIVADKIPALDSLNDIVQTVVRPASGGIVFGAGASAEALTLDNPSALLSTDWVPLLTGIAIALGVHGVKAIARPAANVATGGIAAPVLSTAEDVTSIGVTLLAVFLPILAGLVVIALIAGALVLVLRKRSRSKRALA